MPSQVPKDVVFAEDKVAIVQKISLAGERDLPTTLKVEFYLPEIKGEHYLYVHLDYRKSESEKAVPSKGDFCSNAFKKLPMPEDQQLIQVALDEIN